MASENLDSILDEIIKVNPQESVNSGQSWEPPRIDDSIFDSSRDVVEQATKFDVNPLAVYDRTHSGKYIPKFENFAGAVGNEERLAKDQSTFEKHLNGFLKFNAKTVAYAADAVIGTVYGISQGIVSQDFSKVWNNDFSIELDEFNKKLDNELPNYKTQEEQSMGVLRSMGTANFWAEDVGGGMAFVTGALLPEIALGVVTEGTSIPSSIAKFSFKFGAKTAFKAAAKKSLKDLAREGGETLIRKLNKSITTKSVGEVIDTGAFLARTSNFEAGMEARHNLHESVDKFYRDFEEFNGRKPTYEEVQQFTTEAISAANGVYTANMAILSVSNAVMFGKKFNIAPALRKRVSNFGNRFIGLGTKSVAGKGTVRTGQNFAQKSLGNAYFILGKPAVEGLYEEGFQGVAGKTMQNYLETLYNPKSEATTGTMSHLFNAFSEQYGTKEGWKEVVVGMIIGSLGGAVQGGPAAGTFSDSRIARSKQLDLQIEAANKGRTNMVNRISNTDSLTQTAALIESGSNSISTNRVLDKAADIEFIKSQESVKTHKQMLEDYNHVVDNMQFTEDQLDDVGEESVQRARESMKEDFKNTLKDYKYATKAVKSLGLDIKIKTTQGEITQMSDALVTMIATGRSSLNIAKDIGSQIDALIGESGTYSHMKFIADITEERKDLVDELVKKRRKVSNLKKQAEKYQRQIAGIQTGGRSFSESTRQKRYNKASEGYVIATQEASRLESEIAELSEAARIYNDREEGPSNFDVERLQVDPVGADLSIALEHLDKLDKYTDALEKAGRLNEAEELNSLMQEFKEQADSYREMNNMLYRMADTNFFSTKEGKWFHRFLRGDKYKMSQDFKDILKENDEFLDTVLNKRGIRGFESVEIALKNFIEDNDNLSEREKFRMESLLRIHLGHKKMAENLEDIQNNVEGVTTQEVRQDNPLEGDTVSLSTKLRTEGQDLTNLDVLNDLIDKVVSEIDSLKKIRGRFEIRRSLKERAKQIRDMEVESDVDQTALDTIVDKLSRGVDLSKDEQVFKERYPQAIDKELVKIKLEEDKSAFNDQGEITTLDTTDFKRMESLISKQDIQGLSESEAKELQDLEDEADLWINMAGTVVEGLRLSDLVKQKIVLENTEIKDVDSLNEVTAQEKLDIIKFSGANSAANYSIGQTYEAVFTKVNKNGDIEISGIPSEDFTKVLGIEIPFQVNEQGNIIIQDEDGSIIDDINKNSNLSILATNKSLSTQYNVVLVTEQGLDGTQVTRPLISQFNESFSTEMNPDEIYAKDEGEQIFFEVSPEDSLNADLLEEYKATENPSEELLDRMRSTMVIRMVDANGKFLGVLKAKRKNAPNNRESALFEALRDSVINDSSVMDGLIANVNQRLDVGDVTVGKVFMGHPNYNFKKDSDGTVSIESKIIDAKDIRFIKDVGIVKNGKVSTRQSLEGVNTTYLTSAKRREGSSVTPFVVLEKSGKKIAYPVSTPTQERDITSEFQAIYDSNLGIVEKAIALNKFMADNGIDIKESGNSFAGYDKTTMTQEFFDQKLAQLEGIQYFQDFNEWVDSSTLVEDIIGRGVSIDLDIKNPFHSPKLKMDISNMTVDIVDVQTPIIEQEEVAQDDLNLGAEEFLSELKKPC